MQSRNKNSIFLPEMAIMVNNNNLWNGIANTSRSSLSCTPRLIPCLSLRSTSQDNILPSPPSIVKRPYSFTCDGLEEPLPYQPSLDAMEQAGTVQTMFRLKPLPQHQDQDYEIDHENVPRTMPTSYDVPSSRRHGYGMVPARDPSKKLVCPIILPTKAP